MERDTPTRSALKKGQHRFAIYRSVNLGCPLFPSGNYGHLLISCGCFLEIILPGAPVWFQFKELVERENAQEAVKLYEKMHTSGYLDWVDERKLTRLFMQHSPTCNISFEEAEDIERWIHDYIKDHCSTIATTIWDGGKPLAS